MRKKHASELTRLISARLFDIHTALMALDSADLRAVANDLLELDGRNCWWFERRTADAMRQLVLLTLKEKDDQQRRSSEILRGPL